MGACGRCVRRVPNGIFKRIPPMRLGSRNLDLNIAATHRRAHCFNNALHMGTQLRPLLNPENHDGDFPVRKILLVAQILVGRQQNIEASLFGNRQ